MISKYLPNSIINAERTYKKNGRKKKGIESESYFILYLRFGVEMCDSMFFLLP